MRQEDKCQRFLRILPKIEWFIVENFSDKLLPELIRLAEAGEKSLLMDHCQNIWFILPDDKFNIRVNPPGWAEFLALLED